MNETIQKLTTATCKFCKLLLQSDQGIKCTGSKCSVILHANCFESISEVVYFKGCQFVCKDCTIQREIVSFLNESVRSDRENKKFSNIKENSDVKKDKIEIAKKKGATDTINQKDIFVEQIKNLQIDTLERLLEVVADLVFRKAVDEPNFSVVYAAMCKELALIQVPTANSTNEKKEYVTFLKLILRRCQVEFEKQSVDESERNTKVKEIEECTDPERKKNLIFDLDEYDRKLRMKSIGNIRFIGELFKQQMLTVNTMMRCLDNLLSNKDEESLECLCKLLTTIGKELEAKNVNLSHHFQTMKEIVDKKHGKVSSRVRFMLQDVIDLRLSNWVPRRQDLYPKTIDQKQKEAETVKNGLSLRAKNVKLNEAENAWRPARLNQGPDMTEDDRKTADLYNKVRGILNKLTPQKYEILVGQVKNLQIDTVERLQGVIELIFRKAVDEPNFSVVYAAMCKELAPIQVPTANSTNEKKKIF